MRFLYQFYNYYLSGDNNFVKSLSATLGFVPVHLHLYKRAFIHKSYANEQDDYQYNNERLEYLGDAVLGCVVAEYLFRKYPQKDEGFLTKMRSKIVNRKVLNDVADRMGLDVFMRHCGGAHISHSMLGNAFEAFIGAIYLDMGYHGTKQFLIRKVLREYIDIHMLETVNNNFKSQLLEWCQKSQHTVAYELINRFKLNKRDRFKVAVLVDSKQIATGEDFSKKSAEQIASKRALSSLGILKPTESENSATK